MTTELIALKCPSCGELMDGPTPYKSWGPATPGVRSETIYGDRPEPQWLADLPVAGHKFRCSCGCTIDVPVPDPAINPEGSTGTRTRKET